MTDENIAAVKDLIKEDRHIDYGEIEATLKIESITPQIKIKDHLHLTKRFSHWISHQLMPKQTEERVEWCPSCWEDSEEDKQRKFSISSQVTNPEYIIRI